MNLIYKTNFFKHKLMKKKKKNHNYKSLKNLFMRPKDKILYSWKKLEMSELASNKVLSDEFYYEELLVHTPLGVR